MTTIGHQLPSSEPSAALLVRPPGDGSPMRSPCLHRLMHIDSSGSSDNESHCGSPKRGLSFETKEPTIPQPLNLDCIEEEKPLVPGVTVRAATVCKLANMAIKCFDGETGEVLGESGEFPRVLLLMHQWFIPSEQLAERFMELYNTISSHGICTAGGCSHKFKLPKCGHQQYRIKTCYLFSYWIATFPMHFDLNPRLSRCVQRFQDMIESSGDPHLPQLLDISKVPSYDWMRNMSVRNPNNLRSEKQVNLLFNTLPPSELAEQLTFLEYKAFRRITFNDFKHYAIQASLKDNPKLERSIALFNGLSQWVQCMILSKTTPQERSEIIVKFVDVAKRLRQLQNFNTLMAVIGGLTHSALARLNKTNACIPAETQKVLMDMTELLSSSNNFSNYRRALHSCRGFRIPILGVHLKDLILLNTALSDKVEGVLVNFRKMAQLSITFTELMLVQNSSLPVEPNMDLVNMIRLSLDLHYTEDEIYELSLAREPRNSLSSPSTPTKPVVFADWVAGVSPPDPNTINKHVNDMVEAVFKNYDHDKDGFISHAEFELIAGNFPFIDSFCVLDADQDGMISKTEMKTYFIRANSHALRNSFKHDFHEQTYFKPTFCIHCTGLLWGLIKQGWKCKDCGIHAHKHCKDLVVMECRAKMHTEHHSSHKRGSFTNGSHREGSIATKRKLSDRHRRVYYSRGTQTNMDGSEATLEQSVDKSFEIMSLDRGGSVDRGSFERCSFDRSSFERTSFERFSIERGSFERSSFDRCYSFDRTTSIDKGGSFDHGTFIERGSLERASFDRPAFGRSVVHRGRLERASSDRASHEHTGLERAGHERSSSGKGILERTSAHISRSFDQSLVGGMGPDVAMGGSSHHHQHHHNSSAVSNLDGVGKPPAAVTANNSEKDRSSPGDKDSMMDTDSRSSSNSSSKTNNNSSSSNSSSSSTIGSSANNNNNTMGGLCTPSSSSAGGQSTSSSPRFWTNKTSDTDSATPPGPIAGTSISADGGSSATASSSGNSGSSSSGSGGALSATTAPPSSATTISTVPDNTEFYEEQSALFERMLKAEEERDRVLAENEQLRQRCDQQVEQLTVLKSQLGLIRQHTITFILDQMDTLHMQRDTEV